jgi:hypothetical protein
MAENRTEGPTHTIHLMSELVHEVVKDAGLRYAARRLVVAAEQGEVGEPLAEKVSEVFERYAETDEEREIILGHARSFALDAGVDTEEIGVLVDLCDRREIDK